MMAGCSSCLETHPGTLHVACAAVPMAKDGSVASSKARFANPMGGASLFLHRAATSAVSCPEPVNSCGTNGVGLSHGLSLPYAACTLLSHWRHVFSQGFSLGSRSAYSPSCKAPRVSRMFCRSSRVRLACMCEEVMRARRIMFRLCRGGGAASDWKPTWSRRGPRAHPGAGAGGPEGPRALSGCTARAGASVWWGAPLCLWAMRER